MTVYLGFDLGMTTGWCWYDTDRNYIEFGSFKAYEPKIDGKLSVGGKMSILSEKLDLLMTNLKSWNDSPIDVVAIEAPIARANNSAGIGHMAKGVLMPLCDKHGASQFVEIVGSRLKKFTSGDGHCTKGEMIWHAKRVLSSFNVQSLWDGKNDDAVDALFVSLAAADKKGCSEGKPWCYDPNAPRAPKKRKVKAKKEKRSHE